MSEQYRDQARRAEQQDGIENFSDDYVAAFQRQIDNLTELLEKKDTQLVELMNKNGQLKGYSSELREDLEQKYTKAGEVMPRELMMAPAVISPRNDAKISEELAKNKDRREEVL